MKEKYVAESLLGRRFGRLVVVSFAGRNANRNKVFNVKCDCGVEKMVTLPNLIHGNTVSCGCKRIDSPPNRKEKYYSSMWDLYKKYKMSGVRRGYGFGLTLEQFKELTSGACVYCGILPCKENNNKNYNGFYKYNGIDRVDNSRGYEIGNCVSCCEVCNRMKLKMTKEEFLKQVRKIVEFTK